MMTIHVLIMKQLAIFNRMKKHNDRMCLLVDCYSTVAMNMMIVVVILVCFDGALGYSTALQTFRLSV